ncbi:hypothetical protein SAMN05216327_102266 [Dyadobacter sp. SG02]|uniref:putative quinol monooxygenase n=1 Tax=Dyadobacter sp. SG02 TaxID=1855291 RepID=UPI0008B22B2B|nr:hypothetical protein [Dyadobacter sp. SG02]SEI53118.1 hypothetical protein SAMN05216327_102266 [Dyadobacter sp. SG02]
MAQQTIVRIVAQATVEPSDWDAFRAMVRETKEIVAREGHERVLTHACYCDPATFQCLIVEAYANEAALLAHLQLIQPLSEKYRVNWQINRLDLLGPYSNETLAALTGNMDEGAWAHYEIQVPTE